MLVKPALVSLAVVSTVSPAFSVPIPVENRALKLPAGALGGLIKSFGKGVLTSGAVSGLLSILEGGSSNSSAPASRELETRDDSDNDQNPAVGGLNIPTSIVGPDATPTVVDPVLASKLVEGPAAVNVQSGGIFATPIAAIPNLASLGPAKPTVPIHRPIVVPPIRGPSAGPDGTVKPPAALPPIFKSPPIIGPGLVVPPSGVAPPKDQLEARGALASALEKLVGVGAESLGSVLKKTVLGGLASGIAAEGVNAITGQQNRRGIAGALVGDVAQVAEKGLGSVLGNGVAGGIGSSLGSDIGSIFTKLFNNSDNSNTKREFQDLSDEEVNTLLEWVGKVNGVNRRGVSSSIAKGLAGTAAGLAATEGAEELIEKIKSLLGRDIDLNELD